MAGLALKLALKGRDAAWLARIGAVLKAGGTAFVPPRGCSPRLRNRCYDKRAPRPTPICVAS